MITSPRYSQVEVPRRGCRVLGGEIFYIGHIVRRGCRVGAKEISILESINLQDTQGDAGSERVTKATLAL